MTAPAIPKRANTELVTAAYVRTIVGAYDTAVGAILQGPDENTGKITWGNTGFVQVGTINGAIDAYVPVRHAVVSLDVWAANPNQSKRQPWGLAFSVAELIVAATFDTALHDTHAIVTLPTGFPNARVTEFSVISEPTRRTSDPSDYAHVGFDVTISWHGLGDSWTITP